MENYPTKVVRKKRKTKKCLNVLRKNALNKKQTEKCTEKFKNVNNVTKSRITLKHGIFAKGIRTETYSRNCVSEEFKARRDGDLNKLIDLANGVIDRNKNDEITNKQELQAVSDDDLDILPIFINKEVEVNIENDKSRSSKVKIKSNVPRPTDEELDAVIYDPANREIFRRTEIAIDNELKKLLSDKAKEDHINKLKNYLKDVYQETSTKQQDLNKKSTSSLSKIIIDKDSNGTNKSITLNPLKYLSNINKGNIINKYKHTKTIAIVEKDDRFCDSPITCQAAVKCNKTNFKSQKNSDSDDSISSSIHYGLTHFEPPEPTFFPRRMNS